MGSVHSYPQLDGWPGRTVEQQSLETAWNLAHFDGSISVNTATVSTGYVPEWTTSIHSVCWVLSTGSTFLDFVKLLRLQIIFPQVIAATAVSLWVSLFYLGRSKRPGNLLHTYNIQRWPPTAEFWNTTDSECQRSSEDQSAWLADPQIKFVSHSRLWDNKYSTPICITIIVRVWNMAVIKVTPHFWAEKGYFWIFLSLFLSSL